MKKTMTPALWNLHVRGTIRTTINKNKPVNHGPYLKVTTALKKKIKAEKQEINSVVGGGLVIPDGAGKGVPAGDVSAWPTEPGPLGRVSYLQKELLLLTLDLLLHLLIEVLDFFIIGSNFPAEATKGESDESPVSPRGALGGGMTMQVRLAKAAA